MGESSHHKKKQRMLMTSERKHISKGSDKAAESATEGAIEDGAETAELVAEAATTRRLEMYAAIRYAACFHMSVQV